MSLPGPLIVSMTSHPPRYQDLAWVLESLLWQTYKPDAIVLWLAPEEFEVLPAYIKGLSGITIRLCENLGCYKSSIPVLAAYPDAYIATCNDDMIYPTSWLQGFADAYRSDREILTGHARRVTVIDGKIGPYDDWPRARYGEASEFIFPCGRGVMFPPKSLHPDVMDKETFMRLAPHGDDIWKYWMALKVGVVHRCVRPLGEFQDLPCSAVGLYQQFNRGGGNDRQIAAMVEAYGLPWEQRRAAA